jgi:hypothetical protein
MRSRARFWFAAKLVEHGPDTVLFRLLRIDGRLVSIVGSLEQSRINLAELHPFFDFAIKIDMQLDDQEPIQTNRP